MGRSQLALANSFSNQYRARKASRAPSWCGGLGEIQGRGSELQNQYRPNGAVRFQSHSAGGHDDAAGEPDIGGSSKIYPHILLGGAKSPGSTSTSSAN